MLALILCLMAGILIGYVACVLHTSILYALRLTNPPGVYGPRHDTDAIITRIHETPHDTPTHITVTRKGEA